MINAHSDKKESPDGGIAVMAEPLLPAPTPVAVLTDVSVNPLVPAIVEVVAPSTLPEVSIATPARSLANISPRNYRRSLR